MSRLRRPGWARGLGVADLLPIAIAVAVLLLVIVMAVRDLTTDSAEDPEVPEVVVREVTTPDGVEHLCAITAEGGISCDWERPQLPLEADDGEVDQ